MARQYSAQGNIAVGTNKTALTMVSASTIRPSLFDVVIGCDATPADQAARFVIQRFTAAGTVTAVTPEPTDPADPAALATSGSNASVEPTYTAGKILQTIPLNQRATFRWVADPLRGYKAPATAANGLGCQSVAATGTAAHYANFTWEE